MREAAREVFEAWSVSLTNAFVRTGVKKSDAADYASLCIAVVEGALIMGKASRNDEIFDVALRQLTALVKRVGTTR
jgi:hypothetical protein